MVNFLGIGVWTEATPREGGLGTQPNIPDSLYIWMQVGLGDAFNQTFQTLWIKGCQFKSGYFLQAWGNIGEGKSWELVGSCSGRGVAGEVSGLLTS